jgi:hypothetical protein
MFYVLCFIILIIIIIIINYEAKNCCPVYQESTNASTENEKIEVKRKTINGQF